MEWRWEIQLVFGIVATVSMKKCLWNNELVKQGSFIFHFCHLYLIYPMHSSACVWLLSYFFFSFCFKLLSLFDWRAFEIIFNLKKIFNDFLLLIYQVETKVTFRFDAKAHCKSIIAAATIVRLRLALAPLLPAATNASPSTKVIMNELKQASSSRSCAVNGISNNGCGFAIDGNKEPPKARGHWALFSPASPTYLPTLTCNPKCSPLSCCCAFIFLWLDRSAVSERERDAQGRTTNEYKGVAVKLWSALSAAS